MKVTKARFFAQFVFATTGASAARRGYPRDVPPSVRLEIDGELPAPSQQPEFLQGRPENEQAHLYSSAASSPHKAS
ncbi:unnamed protein product, partial [Ectocarpus sp. 12 AP-2014]